MLHHSIEPQTYNKNLADYIHAGRRYKKGIIITFLVILVISALFAILIPPVYRSYTTILIEEQEIPTDLVRSTVTSYAMQRIQEIKARTLTRAVLLELIEKYDLYEGRRQRETTEELLERMRAAIFVEPVSTEIVDPRTARTGEAVIAFNLAFEGEDPITTQKVASELTNKFLSENIKTRTESTEETYSFLTEEARKLDQEIKALEMELANLKDRYPNSMPELEQLNLRLLERTEEQLTTLEANLRELVKTKISLEGKLAQTSPLGPTFASTGDRILDPESRLKGLRTELITKSTRYSEDHPDLVSLRREIKGLEEELGIDVDFSEQAKQLEQFKSDLASMREKYSDEHPDVQGLRRAVAALQAELKAQANTQIQATQSNSKPDNPIYLGLKTQLESTQSSINSLETQKAELKRKLAEYEQRLLDAPQVEKQVRGIARELSNASMRYQEVRAKQMDAEVAQELEKGRKGERFELIEPAQLPEQPERPNRVLIMFLGCILSCVGGFGYGAIRESLDNTVHGARGIALTTGHLPLTTIPRIDNSTEASRKKRTNLIVLGAVIATIILVSALVHWLWVPLDILYFRVIRKLSVLLGI